MNALHPSFGSLASAAQFVFTVTFAQPGTQRAIAATVARDLASSHGVHWLAASIPHKKIPAKVRGD